MRTDEAMVFAEELACIPRFPWGSRPAVAKVAEVIAAMCGTPADAQRLVDTAVAEMGEWTGIPALRAIQAGLRASNDNTWRGLGERPPVNCGRCSDLGWVVEQWRAHRCHCDAARLVTEEELAQLDRIHRRTTGSAPPPKTALDKPSVAELEAILARGRA
jgi:hypothetical protein